MVGNIHVQLAEYLKRIQDGLITLFLVKDEASASLGRIGVRAIEAFDSKLVRDLKWRSTWVLAVKKGHNVYFEGLAHSNKKKRADPIIKTFTIEVDPIKEKCNYNEKRREQFCVKYIGYNALCSCQGPDSIDIKTPALTPNRVYNLPITVIASNRPPYLYKMLTILLNTPGVNRHMITVYIDGFYDETVAVVDLLRVKYVEHTPQCVDRVCRLNQHYKFALHDTFEKHPHAEYVIILEEDLEVAKDIMEYFSQVLPLLESDPSVYCISAWNDNSYNHSANDPSMLYRVEGMTGLGWVLKRNLFKKEFEPVWPGLDSDLDWDMFIRWDGMRKGRHCIIPDISRTFHFGKVGVHMNAYAYDQGAYMTKLNKETGVKFDLGKLTKEGYDNEIKRLIQESKPLKRISDPCSNNFIPSTKGRVYTLYIKYDNGDDSDTWLMLARCFKLWHTDVRGAYKMTFRFWLRQNHIIVIGSSSPFFRYKTSDTPVFGLQKEASKSSKE